MSSSTSNKNIFEESSYEGEKGLSSEDDKLLNKKRSKKDDSSEKKKIKKKKEKEKREKKEKKEHENKSTNEPKKNYKSPESDKKKNYQKKEEIKEKITNLEKSEYMIELDENEDKKSTKAKDKVENIKEKDDKESKSKVKKFDKYVTNDTSGSNNSNEEKEEKEKEKEKETSSKKKNDSKNIYSICVKGIKSSCKERDIKELFKDCGKIKITNINKNIDGTSCAYIDFDNKQSMKLALKKNDSIFQNKKLIITENKETIVDKSEIDKLDAPFQVFRNYIESLIEEERAQFKKEILKYSKLIDDLKAKMIQNTIKLDLSNEIRKQSDIYNRNNNELLNAKINALTNSFKVLYYRKICILVIDKIIGKHKKDLAKTEKIFGDSTKFGVIFAVNDIQKISKRNVNLLIDFLMHIRKISSRIIHFKKLDKFNIPNKVFLELLDIYKGKESSTKNILEIKDINNIIFGLKDKKERETNKPEEKKSELDKAINKYIEKQITLEKKSKESKENNELRISKKEVKQPSKKKEEESEMEEEEIEEKYRSKDDNTLDIKVEDNKFDKFKLDNIMSGKNNEENTLISDLLEQLKEVINLNENTPKAKILKDKDINPEYLYLSWQNSFNDTDYKTTDSFKKVMSLEENFEKNLISLEDMGEIIKKLLTEEKFNFFQKDPDNFYESISNIIKKY